MNYLDEGGRIGIRLILKLFKLSRCTYHCISIFMEHPLLEMQLGRISGINLINNGNNSAPPGKHKNCKRWNCFADVYKLSFTFFFSSSKAIFVVDFSINKHFSYSSLNSLAIFLFLLKVLLFLLSSLTILSSFSLCFYEDLTLYSFAQLQSVFFCSSYQVWHHISNRSKGNIFGHIIAFFC